MYGHYKLWISFRLINELNLVSETNEQCAPFGMCYWPVARPFILDLTKNQNDMGYKDYGGQCLQCTRIEQHLFFSP